tara:strand:+ start:255 stop:395 length:141 start_codon:yes stop_codon:yes gene_type:complete
MDNKVNHEQSAIIDFHLKRIAMLSIFYLSEERIDVALLLPVGVRNK